MKDRIGNIINVEDRVLVAGEMGMPAFVGWMRDIQPSYRNDGTICARVDDGEKNNNHPGKNGCRQSSWSHSEEITLVDANNQPVDPNQMRLFQAVQS